MSVVTMCNQDIDSLLAGAIECYSTLSGESKEEVLKRLHTDKVLEENIKMIMFLALTEK